MTRMEQIKVDSIKMALEVNDGSIRGAARWLGISEKTIYNASERHPELKDHARPDVSTRLRSAKKEYVPPTDPEKRPIGWVPDWYKKKYPSLFVM